MIWFFATLLSLLMVPFIVGAGWFAYQALDCERWKDARLHVGGVGICASGVFFFSVMLLLIGYLQC